MIDVNYILIYVKDGQTEFGFFLIMKFVFVKSLDQIYFKIKINNNNHETVLF